METGGKIEGMNLNIFYSSSELLSCKNTDYRLWKMLCCQAQRSGQSIQKVVGMNIGTIGWSEILKLVTHDELSEVKVGKNIYRLYR